MTTPLAGWYPDPGGGGQRYWDGAAWTNQLRPSPAPSVEAGNVHPLGSAAAAGVFSYIGLLVFLNPMLPGTPAFGAGQLAVPAVVAAGVVGLVARSASGHWSWWVYAVAVPVLSGGLGVVLNLSDVIGTGT